MAHRILVVEDESIVAQDVQNRLERLGYIVSAVTSSGEGAIQEVRKMPPDLVLMDIVLKGQMDGITAAESIHNEFCIPLIYVTAHADKKTLERAKITEPYGYVLKPFEDRELHTAVEMALYKHKMEKKLKESEQWLSTTLRSIGDGIITTDVNGLVTFMNPVAETLTGVRQKDAKSVPLKTIFNIMSEDTGGQVEGLVTRAIKEGSMVPGGRTVLMSRDGKRIPIHNSAAPIRDDKGTVSGVVIVFQDVTERMRAELQLKNLFEASKLINSTIDMKEIFKFISDSLHELIKFDNFIIFLVSEDKKIVPIYLSEGIRSKLKDFVLELDEGLVGHSIKTRETVLLEDAHKDERTAFNIPDMRSQIIAPLVVEGECVGALLVSKSEPHAYNQYDVDVLNPFSEIVSSAVRNSRLHQKIKEFGMEMEKRIKERSRKIEILLNARQNLQIEMNWEKGLSTIVESMKKLGFEQVGIFLVNAMKKTLEFHLGYGISPPKAFSSISLKSSQYFGVKCVTEKRTIYVKDPSFAEGKQIAESESFVWVPIIVQDEAFAATAAGNVSKNLITEEDVNDLEILASMCAAFIDRTRITIEPVAEKALKTEFNNWLTPSECYIFTERKPEKAFNTFCDLVVHGIPGFVISREHPEKIKRKYKLSKTPILWLSRSEIENTLSPEDLSKLNYIIGNFTKKSEESVILLDGLEYLITQTGFDTVLKYLYELKDTIVLSNSRLIIPLHRETLSAREYTILEREFIIQESG